MNEERVMNLIDKYISEYSEDFVFHHSEHISTRVFDVEINVEVFEYSDRSDRREKARVAFQKGDRTYECDFCDEHDYENGFYPITLNNQRFICFRKTLYGFTLLNADTLFVEFEYFPENVRKGEEAFIIVDVKQIGDILIFEGCYWACPYECFAFDYNKKLFLNVSKICDIFSVSETVVKDNTLIMYGTDETNAKKQIALLAQDITDGINQHGQTDF